MNARHGSTRDGVVGDRETTIVTRRLLWASALALFAVACDAGSSPDPEDGSIDAQVDSAPDTGVDSSVDADIDACTGNDGSSEQCMCSSGETDSDLDGTRDCEDECPNEARKVVAGTCGCGLPEEDYDNNGQLDCIAQGGMRPAAITKWHLAVIVVDFADTDPSLRSTYPSNADLETLFFDPSSEMNAYLRDMSYGKLMGLTGDVFGPFEHPRTITDLVSSGDYASEMYPEQHLIDTKGAIQIPGFDPDAYDAIVFIAYDDYSWNPGGLTGLWTFTINGQSVTSSRSTVMALHIGRSQRDPGTEISNAYTKPMDGAVFVPTSVDPNGELGVPHDGHTFTRFSRTVMHELVHGMGITTHARGGYGDGTPLVEPKDGGYTNEDYGDHFSMMGTAEHGSSMCAAYRDYLGWFDNTSQLEITEAGTYNTTLVPINEATGVRSVAIRLPYRVDQFFNTEGARFRNDGYYLEVRDNKRWDSALKHSMLAANTEGVLIAFYDGFTSYRLDPSPAPYLSYDWGQTPDRRDLALLPGQTFETPDLRITCTGKNANGGFDVAVELRDRWPSVNTGQ